MRLHGQERQVDLLEHVRLCCFKTIYLRELNLSTRCCITLKYLKIIVCMKLLFYVRYFRTFCTSINTFNAKHFESTRKNTSRHRNAFSDISVFFDMTSAAHAVRYDVSKVRTEVNSKNKTVNHVSDIPITYISDFYGTYLTEDDVRKVL